MTPNAIALVMRPLAANASAHPYDVLKMKSVLAALGHYEAPEWGLSQFSDPALFDALRTFQEKRGLKVDGVMKPGGETEETLLSTLNVGQAGTAIRAAAAALQEMGQGGDEILAHITPEEAQWLDAITDGASVNPHTGLLEFWYDHEAHAYGVGDREQNSGPDRPDGKGDGGNRRHDASADHKTNQNSGNQNSGNQPRGFDPSADQKARQNEVADVMRANDEEGQAQMRRNTVLTLDNDPSFTAGFLDTKAPPTPPDEREQEIWGSQEYWSENDPPMPQSPKKDHPLSYRP